MIFTEFRFLLFFALAFAVYWALRSNGPRKLWLLSCSYVFYGAWDWRFLGLILFSTLVDFGVGLLLGRTHDARARKRWIVLSCVVNLGVLGLFKYANFFIESAVRLAHAMGLPATEAQLSIVLPVGISFFTFQSMSYTLDVYRKELAPVKSVTDFALFVAFFPQLVAGPIVRARDFLPQLTAARPWTDVRVRACLTLFLVGFVKKAVVSDNVVALVDPYFEHPELYSALGAWTAVLMYAVQIYCDFSGYSDMAIATAGLFGYELRLNFDFPYLAADIREFWRRWHMSLSTWLRDYLYVPLGGSRGSLAFTYRNLMLTMLLGGLWHGAGWHFVIWGGMHGAALVLHREWARRGLSLPVPAALLRPIGVALTFYFVCVAWILFRATDLAGAATVLRAFVLCDGAGARDWGLAPIATFAALATFHALGSTHVVTRWADRIPAPAYAVLYGIAAPLALAFMNGAVQPFIYFQF